MNDEGITKERLLFYFDSANLKSYPGEATTNSISAINAYPSVGNGWGTYNVNQYNGGSYFSIGTVSGVSDNVVTTATNHPLRTYDVVRPQTTGGGVTAGVDYYIKKVSNTQFSIHQYLGTQNGSLGFTCLANIQTNTKISINSTDFPTMWWGYPHLGNSGIIKTIVPNGFDYEGRRHDFLRHHTYRPDSVVDGMAYGVAPLVGGEITLTISCMMRAVSADTVYINWQGYFAGATPQSFYGYYGNVTRDWTKYSVTKTTLTGATYLYLYWLYQSALSIIDISEIQVELNKDHATLFTVGTRDGNGIDLISNNTITFSGTKHITTSEKSIYFNGTTDHAYISPFNFPADTSCEIWVKSSSYNGKVILSFDSDGFGSGPNIFFNASTICWNTGDGGGNPFTNSSYPGSDWVHIVVTNNTVSGVATLYINSVLIGTATAKSTLTTNGSLYIGRYHGDNNYNINGYIGIVRVYSKILTLSEITKNYNLTKGRFGL